MEQAEALQDDFTEQPEAAQEESTIDHIEQNKDRYEPPEEPDSGSEDGGEDDIDNESNLYDTVQYEGKEYSVPKELKDAFLRQADYTQKTQEVAQSRQALEQQQHEFQQAVQMQRQNIQSYAQLFALQNQLSEYNGVNWDLFSAEQPQEAQQAFIRYQQLKDATGNLAQQLQQQEAKSLQMQREMTVRRVEQGKAELERDIKGWNSTMAMEVAKYGQSVGASPEALKFIEPYQVKILRKAMLYDQSMKKATKPEEPALKPSIKVRGKANVNKDPDKMSTKEWLAWRTKQLS
jgi:hypothetical protein